MVSLREPQQQAVFPTGVVSYLRAHWRGELPLATSLGINMLGGLVLLSWAELNWLSWSTSNPGRMMERTLLSLLFSRVIVFSWQLVGLVRAIERDYLQTRDILKTRACQVVALACLLFNLVYALEVIQGVSYYRHQLEVYTRHETRVAYRLELDADGRQLFISGGLEPGITDAVRSKLDAETGVASVVLDSKGGQVYEGRGLARLFAERALDTYVFGECSSSCATAFIGGNQRFLGPRGRLGFHRYRLDRTGFERIVPFYNLQAEQDRDLALFRQRGVAPLFLKHMFSRSASELWYPEQALLLESGVVNQVIEIRP